jgi:hypothetical protein
MWMHCQAYSQKSQAGIRDTTAVNVKANCTCPAIDPGDIFPGRRLIFYNHDDKEMRARNDEQWKAYSHDSVRLRVNTISFSDYDTIPARFKIFENVVRVVIQSRKGIAGLDNFPKLKKVEFFLSTVTLDPNDAWLKTIEVLVVEKTDIAGLMSFKSMPNLVQLHMAFSGFDQFPSDIESLTCLRELTLGAHRGGPIDLKGIDLTKFKCLKEARFITWYNTLTGIPRGLQDPNVNIILEVEHGNLTQTEKSKLKQYNARVKKSLGKSQP